MGHTFFFFFFFLCGERRLQSCNLTKAIETRIIVVVLVTNICYIFREV